MTANATDAEVRLRDIPNLARHEQVAILWIVLFSGVVALAAPSALNGANSLPIRVVDGLLTVVAGGLGLAELRNLDRALREVPRAE